MGELDNTLVIYIFGDNGASLEGTITGSFNELTMQNGIALTPEQQLSLIDQYGGLDAWGTDAFAPHYASAWAWAGQHAVSVGQAGRLAPRRHAQRHGRLLARADQGRRRLAFPVHPLHRHRADDPRSGRDPRAQGGRRDRAEADGGDELPVQLRRRRARPSGTRCSTSRSSATGRSTRTAGGPRACSTASPGTLSPPTMARFAPGTYDPEQDTWELYYLPDDFTPGQRPRRRAPREARRAEGALLGGGREAQRAAAAGGVLGLLRDPAADADYHDAHLLRRRRRTSPPG